MVSETPELVGLQTDVPQETFEMMRKKAPAGEAMSKTELARYWIARGLELTELEHNRAKSD